MNETRLRLGLIQAGCGVILTLLGPYLLWLVPDDFPEILAVVSALFPVLTILGLSNCRKATPSTVPAATISWLSCVVATMLQAGVSLAAWALNISSYGALGQFLMIAALFHLVSLQFLLVFAMHVASLIGAPELAARFRNLSAVAPIASLSVFYVFLIYPQLVFSAVLLVTSAFLVLLSRALWSLAASVGQPLSLE